MADITGTPFDDNLIGTADADSIQGLAGAGSISGLGGTGAWREHDRAGGEPGGGVARL